MSISSSRNTSLSHILFNCLKGLQWLNHSHSEDDGEQYRIDDYTRGCIDNHIDYEKWNNHQRIESNEQIFRVMGQILGYPNSNWYTDG